MAAGAALRRELKVSELLFLYAGHRQGCEPPLPAYRNFCAAPTAESGWGPALCPGAAGFPTVTDADRSRAAWRRAKPASTQERISEKRITVTVSSRLTWRL